MIGSLHSLRSVTKPNCTSLLYDRIETPMPMSPDCGTQNIRLSILAPDKIERLLRSGNVGHHGGRIPRQRREQLLLQQLRPGPHGSENAQREQRLIRALELLHVGAHRVQPLHRILDAKRQDRGTPGRSGCPVSTPSPAAAGSPAPTRAPSRRHTSSPRRLRYERSAPATEDSSTSLTEQSSARPMALTSVSGSRSAHATRLATPGLPLKRVRESSPIMASFAISEVSALP